MFSRMPRTGHEVAVHKAVNDLMGDVRWMSLLADVVNKLRSGYYLSGWVDVILQHWEGDARYDLYDAYCFAQIHSAVLSGRILVAEVETCGTPADDKQVTKNNAILGRLPKPFTGKFNGGVSDEDGWIAWNSATMFGQEIGNGSKKRDVIPPSRLPLEVGYTKGSRTLLHLAMERGVARWPYGSSRICLLKVVDCRYLSF